MILPLTGDSVFPGIKLLSAEGHYLHLWPVSERSQELACLPGLAFCPHSLVRKTQTALPNPGPGQVTAGSESCLITDLQSPCTALHSQKDLSTLGQTNSKNPGAVLGAMNAAPGLTRSRTLAEIISLMFPYLWPARAALFL